MKRGVIYFILLLFILFLFSVLAQEKDRASKSSCPEEAYRCDADGYSRQVCSKGVWVTSLKCAYGCENNKCSIPSTQTGIPSKTISPSYYCKESTTRCNQENRVEQCVHQKWELKEECGLKCAFGECVDSTLSKTSKAAKVTQAWEQKREKQYCKGCTLGKSCYPPGTVLKNKLCTKKLGWKDLKEKGKCRSDQECKEGICMSGQCISSKEKKLKLPAKKVVKSMPVTDDERAPTISSPRNIIPAPSTGVSGTLFTISAAGITDDVGPVTVTLTISSEIGEEYNLSLTDEDDDGTYHGVWDSTDVPLGEYTLTLMATDAGGNIVTEQSDHLIQVVEEFPCNEVLAGHNNPDENRINVIFAVVNFDEGLHGEKEGFIREVVNGTEKSLLQIEPYASNLELFNFWYVDSIGRVEEYAEGFDYYASESRDAVQSLSSSCIFSNKYTIALLDWHFRSNAAIDGELARISLYQEGNEGIQTLTTEETARITAHEFGHSFGGLRDEYLEGVRDETITNAQCYYSSTVSCGDVVDEERGRSYYGCSTTAESILDCEQNSLWRDLLGNGCGEDGIIDCTDEDEQFRLEETCFNVGCLLAYNLHRHSTNTIMRDHRTEPFSYGPVNQRGICNQIVEKTGSVSDWCEQLCLEGCADGGRCVEGVCIDI